MKKLIISITVAVLLIISIPVSVFGANADALTELSEGDIVEVPNTNIILDGALIQYSNVPINIKGRIMLPLRDILVSLGVPDENIIYNEEEKSITATKDQTKIYMVVGENTAYINDKPVTLDVAPIIYSKISRTYVPVRFVSEAFDKKVIYDGSSYAVYICDIEKYYNIRGIFNKSNDAMSEIEKCKQSTLVDVNAKSGAVDVTVNIKLDSITDIVQKKMYSNMVMNMFGMEIAAETYYADNASYVTEPFTGSWQKNTYLPVEYDELFKSQSNTYVLGVNDSLYAGLSVAESSNPDEILLKGDVYLNELFNKTLAKQMGEDTTDLMGEMELDAFNIEISINKNTYLINSIKMNVGITQTTDELSTGSMEMSATIQYSDYDGDFEIVIPEEVLNSAVEVESDTLL